MAGTSAARFTHQLQLSVGYRYEHNIDPQTDYKPPNGNHVSAELAIT